MCARILTIGNEHETRATRDILANRGLDLVSESDPGRASARLEDGFDAVILPVRHTATRHSWPNGPSLLERIIQKSPQSSVVVLTGPSELDLAVRAVDRGAVDFIVYPGSPQKSWATVQAAIKLTAARKGSNGSAAPEADDLNLENAERRLIGKALKKHNGNITRAARDLGLTRPALYRRIDRYQLARV